MTSIFLSENRLPMRWRIPVLALAATIAAFLPDVAAADDADKIAKLERQVKELSGRVPGQAHVMADIAYHFGNLWYAAKAGNWPLAEFYLNEARSHLRWAVRVRPVRPLSNGGELQVADMLAVMEKTTLKDLQERVAERDAKHFAASYEQVLASCYACHVAAEKPYLRLHVPERVPETMVEFDPAGRGSP